MNAVPVFERNIRVVLLRVSDMNEVMSDVGDFSEYNESNWTRKELEHHVRKTCDFGVICILIQVIFDELCEKLDVHESFSTFSDSW